MDINGMVATLEFVASAGVCQGYHPDNLRNIAKRLVELDETVKRQAEQLAANEVTIHVKRHDENFTAIIDFEMTVSDPCVFQHRTETDYVHLQEKRHDFDEYLAKATAGNLVRKFKDEVAEKIFNIFQKEKLLEMPAARKEGGR